MSDFDVFMVFKRDKYLNDGRVERSIGIVLWSQQFLFKLQASVGDIFCPRLRGCFNHSVKVCQNYSVKCPDEIKISHFAKFGIAQILKIVLLLFSTYEFYIMFC